MGAGVRARRGAALIVLAGLLLAACGGSKSNNSASSTSTTEGKPVRGGTLEFGLINETVSWSPATTIWDQSGYLVAHAIYDRLAAYGADGQVHPYLAKSITSNKEFTVWTIEVRPGVTFHDGTPLDAKALLTHFTAIRNSPIWHGVLGPVTDMKIVGPLSLQITFSKPFSTFPNVLTFQPGYVAAPSVYASAQGGNHPVGTGPFVFKQWVQDSHLLATRNAHYWRKGYPLLDAIDFKVMADADTRNAALRSGSIDIMETDWAPHIKEYQANPGSFSIYLDKKGEGTELTLLLNAGMAPFDDPVARKAVSYAIDRDLISKTLYVGMFPPADDGPFKSNSPWSTGVKFPTFDLAKAKQYADEYEAKHGQPISFTYTTFPGSNNAQIAATLKEMMKRVDIDMKVQVEDFAAALAGAAYGKLQAGATTLLWGSQHPDREYVTLHSSTYAPVGQFSTNATRLRDPQIDKALDDARTTDDMKKQVADWSIVQERLADLNNFVWIVHLDIGDIASNKVHDVTNWTFPDGTKGRPIEQTVVFPYQIWKSS
jgi:ABC-type transport system substrate-binding protein